MRRRRLGAGDDALERIGAGDEALDRITGAGDEALEEGREDVEEVLPRSQ